MSAPSSTYTVSADGRDILRSATQDAYDAKVISADWRIVDGEERIARVRCLIGRLQAMGFDTSVADDLLVTMTQSLDLIRDHRRLLASEKWRAPTVFPAAVD